jgi:hypothetical protein
VCVGAGGGGGGQRLNGNAIKETETSTVMTESNTCLHLW